MPSRHTVLGRRSMAFGLAGTLLGAFVVSAGATAQSVELLGGITDPGNVLSECRQPLLDAEQALFDATGTQLYVAIVPNTAGDDVVDIAEQTFDDNSLTGKDVLFVGTTTDPPRGLIQPGVGLDDTLSQAELDGITQDIREPALAGDWCTASLGVAAGLTTALAPAPSSGGGLSMWLVVLVILLVVGGIAFWFLRGRANRAVYQERAAQEDLGKQASGLLIATDDALRSADQELGFAQAQFGDTAAAPFAAALESAKADLRQAFLVSQQLDDDTPETPQQRHAMLQDIIDRCTKAQQTVNEQQARITTLRDLSKNVDQVLPQVEASVEAQAARVGPAAALFATLAGQYAAENFQAVRGNPAGAEARLTGARGSLTAAQTALAANDRDEAVSHAQAAQVGVAEATALLDAVDVTQASLAAGAAELTSSIAAVQQDIDQARAALAAGKAAERAADVERAATLLADAQRRAAETPLDVVDATRVVTDANSTIDSVLAGIQASDAAAVRNHATAQTAFANASASVAQASALIAANGASAAGRRASTRVAEAQQYLARAQSLLDQDPATAAQAAKTADALADEAIAEMQASGVGGGLQWGGGPTAGGPGAGGYGPPPVWTNSGSGGGMLESILGGMLGGMLSGGGGGRNSGWNGGSGGFGGFGSGGFGGGGSSSSSSRRSGFGGGSRSSGGSSSRSSGSSRSSRRSGF